MSDKLIKGTKLKIRVRGKIRNGKIIGNFTRTDGRIMYTVQTDSDPPEKYDFFDWGILGKEVV